MSEPLRILHLTEMLSAAGIESFIMNNYRHIDREKVQFDFLVLRNQKEFYDDEVKKLGGQKYYVHSDKSNTLLRVLDESNQIEKFLEAHHYDIVHIHYTTPLRAYYLRAAKRAGVSVRIYHSHSAYVSGKSKTKLIIYSILRGKMEAWGTHWFSCSMAAAKWMYPKQLIDSEKVKIIHNGIDTKKFAYDPEARNRIREAEGLKGRFVIINTGRLSDQKNQLFLVEIMREVVKNDPSTMLLLLGKGEKEAEIRRKVSEYSLSDNVRLLGVHDNVYDYLSAADCYVMPSLYEGLPVAGIEAQCNGLPCIFSTDITDEVKVLDTTRFLSLDSTPEIWAKQLLELRNKERTDGSEALRRVGYDIKDVSKELEQFYLGKGRL